jgi:hypothetical protein
MRLKMNTMRRSIAAALLLLSACDTQVLQEVVGTVSTGSEPAASLELRLYSAETCDGPVLATTTDEHGDFRLQTESTRGGVGVVTQSLTLCVNEGSKLKVLWSSTHGGGASRISLTCDTTASEGKACSDVFRYGDRDA